MCFLHGHGQLTLETLDFPGATGWRQQEEAERWWGEGAGEEDGDKPLLGMKEQTVPLERRHALPTPCAWNNFPFNNAAVVCLFSSIKAPR